MEANNSHLRIRLAVVEDAHAVAMVLRAAFREYEPLYTPAAFAATTPDSTQVRQRLAEGPVWVAALHGAVVGTVAAVVKGDALYVRGMANAPAARGRRMGELLLRQVETFAVAQGCLRLYLSTAPFLTRAIRLYEQQGFQRSQAGPDELYGTPLLTMEKILTL